MNRPPIPCFLSIAFGASIAEVCYPTYIYYFTTSKGFRTNEVVTLPHAADSICFSAGGISTPLDSNPNLAKLYVVQNVAAQGKLASIEVLSPA
jgi:hypothetical protein